MLKEYIRWEDLLVACEILIFSMLYSPPPDKGCTGKNVDVSLPAASIFALEFNLWFALDFA